jgi:histo-blood group ABO system transferase
MDSSKNKTPKIGVLIIATNRYNDFVQPLITSADEYFLGDKDVTYFLFTNEDVNITSRSKVVSNKINHAPWPWMTLGRYSIFEHFENQLLEMDYLFYCDADMLFVDNVGDEIISDRVATQHPGYAGKRGEPETRPQSTACIYPNEQMQYFAGGFNGGTSYEYLKMAKTISNNIRKDIENNIIAIWHDESHLNRYFINNPPTKILDPTYCCPEQSNLTGRKLLALLKNHNEIRI